MNNLQMLSLSLATVLAGSVHAQGCSGGGNDSGMDATGNQCNTINEVAAVATGSAIAAPTKMTKVDSVRASTAAALASARSLARTSSQTSAPAAMAVPASSKLVSAKATKTALVSEAFCSGGASGMDVNGNECGEASAATATGRDLRDHLP